MPRTYRQDKSREVFSLYPTPHSKNASFRSNTTLLAELAFRFDCMKHGWSVCQCPIPVETLKILMSETNQFPNTSLALQRINEIPNGVVPYISVLHLFISVLYSCGTWLDVEENENKAGDAHSLLRVVISEHGSARLTSEQQANVLPCLGDVGWYVKSEHFWKGVVGIPWRSNATAKRS